MNDFPTTLRVIAAYKAGEDLAERLATAVNVQKSMAEALNKAADEIERLEASKAEDGRMMSALIEECQQMKHRLVNGDEGTAVSDNCVADNYQELGYRLADDEREAIEAMACYFDARGNLTMQSWGSLLRILLERLK